jgi:plasmid maintenance system antidote protein VapI
LASITRRKRQLLRWTRYADRINHGNGDYVYPGPGLNRTWLRHRRALRRRRKALKFTPDWTVSPGEVLADQMACLKVTIATLAEKTGLDPGLIDGILEGATPLTKEVALVLDDHLHLPWALMVALELNYRDFLTKR